MELPKPKVLDITGNFSENLHIFTEELNNYFISSNTVQNCNEDQVIALKNLMGPEALKLYNTITNISVEQETVTNILTVFEEYCTEKNELVKMFRFFTRKQEVDESFDKYYEELNELVKLCNFANQEERILRTQLVIGISNLEAQEKILQEDMSLENIILYCKSEELNQKDTNISVNDNNKVVQHTKIKKSARNLLSGVKSCSCVYHESSCQTKGRKCNKCKEPNRYVITKKRKLEQLDKGPLCSCLDIKSENNGTNKQMDDTSSFSSNQETILQELPEKKLYPCDECTKIYTDSRHLVRHKRLHTDELPFVCEYCSKGFRDSGDLKKHVRYHTGEKNFQCNLCQKKFFRNHDLQNHYRIHTGEKPWVCDICAKAFTAQSSLILHKRYHTGEKPYECDLCPKRFSQTTDLRRHRRLHTDERPFACLICNRRFNEKAQLKRHLTTHNK